MTGATDAPEDDPRITPPEAVVESEPEQWWTIGRRARVGAALAGEVPAARRDDPALLIAGLPAPYDHLNSEVLDGLALYRARHALGLADALFGAEGVPLTEPSDDWQPAELRYDSRFHAGAATLEIPDHRGDDVDWFSIRATGGDPVGVGDPVELRAHPTRVTYPGAPVPRWWQISDHRFDPGAVAPQRTHLANLIMIHVVSSHADDWFVAPVVIPTAALVGVDSLEVVDSMGLTTTGDVVEGWSMFRISGLDNQTMVAWPTAVGALTGPTPLDEVLVGVDEDANLLRAVERRVDGSELPTDAAPVVAPYPPLPTGQVAVNRPRRYRYRPSTRMLPHWHPYVLTELEDRRLFVQARLADLDQRPVEPLPGPLSRLLRDRAAGPEDPDHVLDPAAIPSRGIRLDRRHRLGRRTDGLPVLWIQRRSTPLPAAPASSLRFDVLEEVPEIVEPTP